MSRAAEDREEEGIDKAKQQRREAWLALAAVFQAQQIAEPKWPTGRYRSELTERVAEKLAAGWPAPAITAAVGESLAGASSLFAVLRHRLAQLPEAAPQVAPLPSQRKDRCRVAPTHAPYPAARCPLCEIEPEAEPLSGAAARAEVAAKIREGRERLAARLTGEGVPASHADRMAGLEQVLVEQKSLTNA